MDLESDKQDTKIKDWVDLINESVHTADDADIGDIDAVSRDFVVVKKRNSKYTLLLYSYK
jgi:hypothetical protein